MSPLFSIIIVNWNTRQLTAKCITSVYEKNSLTSFEIIVVDNASSDGSIPWLQQQFPQVRFFCNATNTGFARANNQAIAAAQGEMLLLLNSDAVLKTPEPLLRLSRCFNECPETAVIGAKLLFPDGRIQSVGRDFLTLKKCIQQQLLFSAATLRPRKDPGTRPLQADYVDGAFLAVRKTVIDQVGKLNESYFMYAEDMEWCARIRAAGYTIVVLPEIEVVHHHAASSRQHFARMLIESASNVSRFIYIQEGPRHAKAAFIVHLLGMALRIPISLFRKPGLTGAYWQGLRRALACLGDLDAIFQEAP
ncbi:MAG TPA: glycosyltransferase family 2 protein [bacterium]|nr:glycosyltransferase family 2 protein [bacterium]HQJ64205.1 glycosyltransferase family 2 protein [bacterium]